jgi:hypothetical protein
MGISIDYLMHIESAQVTADSVQIEFKDGSKKVLPRNTMVVIHRDESMSEIVAEMLRSGDKIIHIEEDFDDEE